MKKILFTILLLLIASPCFALSGAIQACLSAGGAASCTTSNDSALFDKVATGSADNSAYACTKFTLASNSTITEYLVRNQIGTAGTGTVVASIWTHNSGTDLPDSEITNTVKAIAGSSLSVSEETATFTLDTPYAISSGTYWACSRSTGNTVRQYFYYADTGTRSCYGSASCSSGSANIAIGISVYGCTP